MAQATVSKRKMLHNIDSLTNVTNVTEPVISERRKADLTEKLELEKTALKLVAERNKRNDLILSYDYNPFQHQAPPKTPTVNAPMSTREKLMVTRTIIDQIDKLPQQPPRADFIKQSNNLINTMGDLMLLSQKLNIELERTTFKFHKAETTGKAEDKGENPELNELTMKLSEIDRIEEPNANLERPKNLDLLKEASRYLRSGTIGEEYLEELYFVHNDMIETLGSVTKESLYREMSRMARLVMKGKPIKENILDFLDSYELSFNVRDLNFKDIMNVATGRFRQDFLFTYLNEIEMEKDDKLSLSLSADDEQPNYRPDQQNVGALTDDLDISEFEIECLIKAPLESDEITIRRNYDELLSSIQEQISMKKKALERGINDRNVHESRRRKIIDSLRVFRLPNQMTDRELKKLVGKNKLKKNKEEEIKLETFKRAVKSTIRGQKEEIELTSTIIYQS